MNSSISPVLQKLSPTMQEKMSGLMVELLEQFISQSFPRLLEMQKLEQKPFLIETGVSLYPSQFARADIEFVWELVVFCGESTRSTTNLISIDLDSEMVVHEPLLVVSRQSNRLVRESMTTHRRIYLDLVKGGWHTNKGVRMHPDEALSVWLYGPLELVELSRELTQNVPELDSLEQELSNLHPLEQTIINAIADALVEVSPQAGVSLFSEFSIGVFTTPQKPGSAFVMCIQEHNKAGMFHLVDVQEVDGRQGVVIEEMEYLDNPVRFEGTWHEIQRIDAKGVFMMENQRYVKNERMTHLLLERMRWIAQPEMVSSC